MRSLPAERVSQQDRRASATVWDIGFAPARKRAMAPVAEISPLAGFDAGPASSLAGTLLSAR